MNVEANRCMHPIQPLPRNTLGFEVLPDLGNPGLAAEHTQVAGWTIIDLLQDGMVVPMPTRHQYHIIILAEVERLPHASKWHDQSCIGFWKAFLVDKGRIIIDDTHPEPDQGRGTTRGATICPPPNTHKVGVGSMGSSNSRSVLPSSVW
jgi:hypothetical protein